MDKPVWIMTSLEAKRGLQIYIARMKIDQSIRDLITVLRLTKLMNKRQEYAEKMFTLLLLVFTIGLLVGEELRVWLYGEQIAGETKMETLFWSICTAQSKLATPQSPKSSHFSCRFDHLSQPGSSICPNFCLNLSYLPKATINKPSMLVRYESKR
ncbi:MAG: hypothetical protein N3D16_05925 [Anaerolineales bacterium]|nr:hypothetical protein [Anaerolineales bacterium]